MATSCRILAALALLCVHGCRSTDPGSAPDVGDDLQRRYEDFASTLDTERFKEGYPAVMAKLAATDRETRNVALRTIAQSRETDAIPLLVDLVLNEEDRSVRISAGFALQKIVSDNELKRRDPEHPDKMVLLPRGPSDVDLRPMAWVCRRMLEIPEEGLHSYAATMIGYLDLKDLEPNLRELLGSRHPAVTHSAVYALRVMGFVVEKEPHPLPALVPR